MKHNYSYLIEVWFGLDLAGSLVPLEVLPEIIRDGVLGAPPEQTLGLSEMENNRWRRVRIAHRLRKCVPKASQQSHQGTAAVKQNNNLPFSELL